MAFPHRSDIGEALLREIASRGGSAAPTDVYGALADYFELSVEDLARTTESGESRWNNEVRFARDQLVKRGELEHPHVSGYGVWKITASGRARIR